MHAPISAPTTGTPARPRPTSVVCYTQGSREGHEAATRARIAQQLARLLGCEAVGELAAAPPPGAAPYFVPDRTLEQRHAERELRISCEHDLFGGVVPHAHVATKVITHPLVDRRADRPPGWSDAFPERVAAAVLPGYSAFRRTDALRAARALLPAGPVRVKRARETGGRGQFVARDAAEAQRALEALPDEELARDGVVVETNLGAVRTLSVGQVRVDGITASYYGEQQLTRDHDGAEVYGGSTLWVVRGGYDALLAEPLPAAARTAVERANRYDAAASACFPGFYASRRNYDVALGVDARGVEWCGVLEQSWRIGGASGAEVCALEAFAGDPALGRVRASSVEVYGRCDPPPGALVYYDGDDPRVGRIVKYALLERP